MFDYILKQVGEISVLVERTVQFLKFATQYGTRLAQYQKYVDVALSVGLSVLACWGLSVDLVAAAGFSFTPPYDVVGPILTGVLAGLGSSLFHEVYGLLVLWRKSLKPTV